MTSHLIASIASKKTNKKDNYLAEKE